ncbi:MAG: hypothetical protein J2P57_22895 [Acidimicrobiaceae bacterium]|nr:hypothetical protein [Acidimicrobiaceae bacterium]
MVVEAAVLAGVVVKFVVALVRQYGSGVLDRLEDDATDAAADATVSLGRRLLRRLLGRAESRAVIGSAVSDVAEQPGDEDAAAALRLQIRKVLQADPQLAEELSGMLTKAGVSIVASGDRAVAAQEISGIVVTGDHSSIRR